MRGELPAALWADPHRVRYRDASCTSCSGVARCRREVGLLKALGFVRRQVAFSVSWQTTTVAVIGIIIGVPAGIVVGPHLAGLRRQSRCPPRDGSDRVGRGCRGGGDSCGGQRAGHRARTCRFSTTAGVAPQIGVSSENKMRAGSGT